MEFFNRWQISWVYQAKNIFILPSEPKKFQCVLQKTTKRHSIRSEESQLLIPQGSQMLSFFFSSIFLFLIFFFKKYIFHHCCRIIIPCKSLYVWVSSWPLTAFTSWIYGISCKSFKEVWLLPLRCRAVYNPGASCNVLSKILCSHWTDYSRFTTFYHRPDCYWLDLFSSISHHKSCMNREECWTLLKWIPRCLAHVILNNINSY